MGKDGLPDPGGIEKPSGEYEELELADIEVKIGDPANVINTKIDRCIQLAEHLHKDKVEQWKNADDYFNGDHLKKEPRPRYKSDTVLNLLAPATVNMVSRMTSRTPEPQVFPCPSEKENEYDRNLTKAKDLERVLKFHYERVLLREISKKVAYSLILKEDAFIRPTWNYIEDDVDVEFVRPQDVWVDPEATSVADAAYIIIRRQRSLFWVKRVFPEKWKDVIPAEVREKLNAPEEHNKWFQSQFAVVVDEYFTDSLCVVRTGNVILDGPKKNPLYHWESQEEESLVKNYFLNPKIPLIHMSLYNVGGEFYSRSINKSLIPLMRTINKRKQQIDDNANDLGNGKLIYNRLLLPEQEANKITNQAGCKIGVDGRPDDAVKYESGKPLPNYIPMDLGQSISIFDRIFGEHDISRGAKTMTQTATEASIIREADQGRVKLIVDVWEEGMQELYRWWTQMMALFYDQAHYARYIGDNEAYQYVSLTREDISDGIQVLVKSGSTMPMDRSVIREDMKQLASAGQIDPVTLFEEMGMPNPRKMAIRLLNWQQGVISDEYQPMQASQVYEADRENQEMLLGAEIDPAPNDYHDLHVQAHTAFMAEKGENDAIMRHVVQHLDLLRGGAKVAVPEQGANAPYAQSPPRNSQAMGQGIRKPVQFAPAQKGGGQETSY